MTEAYFLVRLFHDYIGPDLDIFVRYQVHRGIVSKVYTDAVQRMLRKAQRL